MSSQPVIPYFENEKEYIEMAVLACIYGQEAPEYVGCVIDKYEHNGYDDSDWYAVCWDDEKGEIVEINYDTTRCGGGGWAKIDATEDVIRKVYRYYYNSCRYAFDNFYNIQQAKEVKVGDDLKVVRGRKIPAGSVGKCFWRGTRYNYYSYRYEERVGIEIKGERFFIPLEYVEVIGFEQRLIRGKKRKRLIQAEAWRKMPFWIQQIKRKYGRM